MPFNGSFVHLSNKVYIDQEETNLMNLHTASYSGTTAASPINAYLSGTQVKITI
jgi:hypothetical protein